LVVAFAIMVILMVALLGSFGNNLAIIRATQAEEVAQNLGELQVEDLQSMSMASLAALVQLTAAKASGDANYPPDSMASTISYESSGFFASNFYLPGVDSILLAGTASSAQDYVLNTPPPAMLLPGSVSVGNVSRLPVDSTDSGDNVYGVTVFQSAFPKVMKRIQVRLVGDGTEIQPGESFNWDLATTENLLFQYLVTVRWLDTSGKTRSLEFSGYLGEGIIQIIQEAP
jgi:type II secretory pathway pseudopilin PulG